MMIAKNRNLIRVVNHIVIIRRSKNNLKTHGNELGASYIMLSALEQPLLLTKGITVLDVALNFLRSHAGYAPEIFSECTIEPFPNILPAIEAGA